MVDTPFTSDTWQTKSDGCSTLDHMLLCLDEFLARLWEMLEIRAAMTTGERKNKQREKSGTRMKCLTTQSLLYFTEAATNSRPERLPRPKTTQSKSPRHRPYRRRL
ncbi:Hypothetical predicted protein [Pelobates cultripes]|uniref:Uncharacterized protein n=1 Tax=Pelobates cultripes TaxID=61616 RepID=A0AAD1WLT2_PELCU|nr:Hypothetical predicted protein [Pelobates cultripes]